MEVDTKESIGEDYREDDYVGLRYVRKTYRKIVYIHRDTDIDCMHL